MTGAGSQEIRKTSLICAFLLLGNLSIQQQCAADDSQSLIESALDGKFTPESTELPSPVPAAEVAPAPEKEKKQRVESEAAMPELRPAPKVSELDPLLQQQTVKSVPAKAPAFDDANFPEPKEILAPPIHSKIPASTPSVLKVPLGVKIGKSFPIDTTYRGKPTLAPVQTVTFGAAPWAIPAKKQIAATPVAPSIPVPANGAVAVPAGTKPAAEAVVKTSTVNVRFKTLEKIRFTDSIWAYPYPPKPPRQITHHPLSEDGPDLKNRILQHGYTYRPDLSRPYPTGGWRWVLVFDNGMKKAGGGYPHTMITMYPWVNRLLPYILSETREFNLVEKARSENYERVAADYERVHTDLEAQATAKGLQPIEVKVSPRGIAQTALPAGNWWIAATRKSPGLKFYWQVPVTCSGDETMNVELTEANALIIGGGW